MSAIDRVREKFKVPMPGTSKSSKSPSDGSAVPSPTHSETHGHPSAGSAGPPHRDSEKLESTYTRCLDCIHYAAPPPDTAFWCPLVRGRPAVALWAVCTGYQAKPGTPPGPTAPHFDEEAP